MAEWLQDLLLNVYSCADLESTTSSSKHRRICGSNLHSNLLPCSTQTFDGLLLCLCDRMLHINDIAIIQPGCPVIPDCTPMKKVSIGCLSNPSWYSPHQPSPTHSGTFTSQSVRFEAVTRRGAIRNVKGKGRRQSDVTQNDGRAQDPSVLLNSAKKFP